MNPFRQEITDNVVFRLIIEVTLLLVVAVLLAIATEGDVMIILMSLSMGFYTYSVDKEIENQIKKG